MVDMTNSLGADSMFGDFEAVSMEDHHGSNTGQPPPYTFLPDGSLMPAEDAILIAVMGVTGAGKSQFINTLKASRISNNSSQTGQMQHENYATVGKKLKSKTRCIEFFHLQVENRNLILIDTPGFNDKDRSDTDILQDLATWLADTFTKKHLLSGICYMHNITNTRFDATANDNCVMLHKLCGSAGMEIVLLVTSMWDKCQADPELEAEYVDHEKELREDHCADLVEDGARMMRTYNSFESNMECIKSIIAKNPRRVLALQYQICKEGRPLPATDLGDHVMKKARSFELELGVKLAEINKLEDEREQQNLPPSKSLAKQREKLRQDLADARRDQAKLENWTWREAGESALVTASGGFIGFMGVGLTATAVEGGLTAAGYAAVAGVIVADVVLIPLAVVSVVGAATAGGILWHKNWKKGRTAAKEKALQKIRDLQQQHNAHEDEIKKEAELIELRTVFDFRMRLLQEVFSESWRSAMPRDPDQVKRLVEETLPQNFAGDNHHLIICGWQLPKFYRELLEKAESPSPDTLLQIVENTPVIIHSQPHFEITTIGSYITTKWGSVGIELLHMALNTTYQAIIEGREAEHPLAATWPTDIASRSPLRLYAYNDHVVLQLSSAEPDCNVLEANKASVQALLWLCQAARLQSLDCKGPELSRQLRELTIIGTNGQIQSSSVTLYPLAKLEVIESDVLNYGWANITARIIVTETDAET